MKGIILYSSNTGNTKKMAEGIYEGIKNSGQWDILPIKEVENVSEYDVILLGGWAESGNLNKEALAAFEKIKEEDKKIGLFMTMGSRVQTKHGAFCRGKLERLLEAVKYPIGYKIMQGRIAQPIMDKLALAPESVIPKSVKVAMQDGVDSYKEPTKEDYMQIADFFKKEL